MLSALINRYSNRFRVYRNLPKANPHRRSWGTEHIGAMRFDWLGPIIVIALPRKVAENPRGPRFQLTRKES